jgi:type IV pilus assembly protein PilQ
MAMLLKNLDMPEKQVMIEARIIEASTSFTKSLGIHWGLYTDPNIGGGLGINNLQTSFGGLTSTDPMSDDGFTQVPGAFTDIAFGTIGANVKLNMRLNAAATAGLVKIISTPKVATLNHKTAKITQGQQIPYTSATSDKIETKFVEAALSLEVTPHINANGTIVLKIDAKNDAPDRQTSVGTPPINKKQATTEMLLRDGETTVIGGIYVDRDTEGADGVPWLMDIPFIGHLFKSTNTEKSKSELLIFITPRILNVI